MSWKVWATHQVWNCKLEYSRQVCGNKLRNERGARCRGYLCDLVPKREPGLPLCICSHPNLSGDTKARALLDPCRAQMLSWTMGAPLA